MTTRAVTIAAASAAFAFIALAALDAIALMTALTAVAGCVLFASASRSQRLANARLASVAFALQAALGAWLAVSAHIDSATAFSAVLAVELLLGACAAALLVSLAAAAGGALPFAGAGIWAVGWGIHAAPLLWLAAWLSADAHVGEVPQPGGTGILFYLAGGLAIGSKLIASMSNRRHRRVALTALAGFGAAALIATLFAHRLLGATDPSSSSNFARCAFGLAEAASSLSLAGLLALQRKESDALPLPRARVA